MSDFEYTISKVDTKANFSGEPMGFEEPVLLIRIYVLAVYGMGVLVRIYYAL